MKTHPALQQLCARFPENRDRITELWSTVKNEKYLTIDSKLFRDRVLDPLFFELLGEPSATPQEDMRGIVNNVQETVFNNKLHVCGRCLKNGKSEDEARNIKSAYRFSRGDEAGTEYLKCVTCGNSWVR